jgi:hypothetical protein
MREEVPKNDSEPAVERVVGGGREGGGAVWTEGRVVSPLRLMEVDG